MVDSTGRVGIPNRLRGDPQATRLKTAGHVLDRRKRLSRSISLRRFAARGRLAYGSMVLLSLGACAYSGVVQRESVEYNTAAADMANQLTLLNIVRAKEHMPIYYTSIARLTGSLQVTASGGFNPQFKTASPTITNSSTNATTTGNSLTTTKGTSTTPTLTDNTYGANNTLQTSVTNAGGTTTTSSSTSGPISSAGTVVTDLMSRAVTSGGTLYSPSVGGQVVGGPSFDIQILDTQQFYQGVLQETPFSTLETFLDQGFDDKLLMRLFIERIEFRLHADMKEEGKVTHHAGDLVRVVYNTVTDEPIRGAKLPGSDPADYDTPSTVFVLFVECHRLEGAIEKKPAKPLAPTSLLSDEHGNAGRISIKDLTLLDGDKFDLAIREKNEDKPGQPVEPDDGYKWAKHGYMGQEGKDVYVVRESVEKRAPSTPSTCLHRNPKLLPRVERISSSESSMMSQSDNSQSPAGENAEQEGKELSADAVKALKQVQNTVHQLTSILELGVVPPTSQNSTAVYGDGPINTLPVDNQKVQVDVSFVFRSPEGLIRFLGEYLEKQEIPGTVFEYKMELNGVEKGVPLFSVEKDHKHGALVSARLNGHDYSILQTMNKEENMQVLGLVEEIINLQKSSSDRPATVPVHVLP
jgi:hypothetical protein